MSQFYPAPWGIKTKVITGLFGLIVLLIAVQAGPIAAAGLIALVLIAAVYSVRGYSIDGQRLRIYRLGWETSLDLSTLVDASEYDTESQGSLRMAGIGGLFGFVGWFWNAEIGWYQAYATDGSKAVLLDFGDRRVVVTPESPAEFAAAARLNRFLVDPDA